MKPLAPRYALFGSIALCLALYLWLVPARAFVVCNPEPQSVKVRVVDSAFPHADCLFESTAAGVPDGVLAFWLAGITFSPVLGCVIGYEGERLTLVAPVAVDVILGHEARHLFPPHHHHPPLLPFVDLPCEWQA